MGIIVLATLSLLVVIPLLSSADQLFANIFKDLLRNIANLFENFFGLEFLLKSFVGIIGTVILLGAILFWKEKQIFGFLNNRPKEKRMLSDIIAGIVLSGILTLYLLFISIRISTIWVGELPTDFNRTEDLVKTGFWQLFLLTILNICMYLIIYMRTGKIVQKILSFFTISSLLLILITAQNVFKYVTVYGLSYEKFFAFYTVIFCSLVFAWLIYLSFKPTPSNLFKILAFSSLWAYGLIVIMPIEAIIFKTNLHLTQNKNSRININELTMLGFDAVSVVEKNFDLLIKEAQKDYLKKISLEPKVPTNNLQSYYIKDVWIEWIKKNQPEKDKSFYEKSFKELNYKPILKNKLIYPKTRTWVDENSGYKLQYPTKIDHFPYAQISYDGDDYDDVIQFETSPSFEIISYFKNTGSEYEVFEILKLRKENNSTFFTLADLPAHALQRKRAKEDMARYSLLIETPKAILEIGSEEKHKPIEDYWLMDLNDFIKLISNDPEAATIIKSIKIL